MSQNSYLRKFCVQMSQILFLADLTVLRLITTVLAETSKNYISSSSVHKYQKSCSKLIWPFHGLLELYEQNCHEINISVSSVHKYHRSCFKLIWPFYGL